MERPPGHGPEEGMVFNIQRFSVHDGPGIRTTVFLKGCPMRCLWCSNPESQNPSSNLMVRDINCRGCGACIQSCPQGAITIGRNGRVIDWGNCNDCLLCIEACLYGALKRCGSIMTVEEVVEEVLQDNLFYKNSGGGLTLSGGEPLQQSKFAAAILGQCKREGLHTAIETTGHAAWRDMAGVLRFVDLILFDIKHLDPAQHKRATGVGNKAILKNLRRAAACGTVWLRIPLVAGFNDSEAHIAEIATMGKEFGVQNISLLPYHEGGKSKKEQMGMIYEIPQAKAPDDGHLKKLKALIIEKGVPASIGK
ncbi:MAG: glycyl-radical enzyme activating protein [Candidatus Vecturithrix sp.]|jgi:pyruvate formate lyase activating enzyme|nr:glycyl-radical enzyme activating protein [Candidatus Vecturithrix sp.]